LPRSTTSKLSLEDPSVASVGKKVVVDGVQHTVTAVTGSEVTMEETWEVRRQKPPKLVPHRERGHSWWPVREATPRHYKCGKCGSTKVPATRAFETCKEAIVRAVHEY